MINMKNNESNGSTKYNVQGYLIIFFTQAFSLLGSAIVQFSIIWWLTVNTNSAIILTLATLVGLVPGILITPFSGVLCDKWNKKFILIITDFSQALFTLGLIILFLLDIAEVFHILFLLAARGAFQGLQLPASNTIIPLMIPEERINQINGLSSLLNSSIYIISPVIGALLLDSLLLQNLLWLDVFTFIPASITLLLIFIPQLSSHDQQLKNMVSQPSRTVSFWTEYKEGVEYIKNSGLLPFFIIFALLNIFNNPLFSLLPLFVTHVHSGTATDFAFMEALIQTGLLLGSLIMMFWRKFEPSMKKIVYISILIQIALLGFVLVPKGNFIMLAVIGFIFGAFISTMDIQFLSILQIQVPKKLQGRVLSTAFTMIKSILPVGLIVLGSLSELIGLSSVFLASPLIMLLLLVIIITKADFMKNSSTAANLQQNNNNKEFQASGAT